MIKFIYFFSLALTIFSFAMIGSMSDTTLGGFLLIAIAGAFIAGGLAINQLKHNE